MAAESNNIIKWHCPQCAEPVAAQSDGGEATCPKCKHSFVIPSWNAGLCWFCRRNADSEYNTVTLHESWSRHISSSISVREWRTQKVRVPNCHECLDIQNKDAAVKTGMKGEGALWGLALPFFAVVVILFSPEAPTHIKIGVAIAGIVFAPFAIRIAVKVLRHMKSVRMLTRNRLAWTDVNAYPQVAELLEKGFKHGARPPNT